ncbi:hypothetical protein [Paenibacillus ottowii]|uniref:Uncharacterized protein n=1 Tax=Paenibacillus ottowii TaxID=2315729 RepID=A0ABY3AZI4_9BACL|nr:hypothetical protein [Paenibacillus ottowii]TQR92298.1 hypothetical protein FKV70_25600 [Paenibacillus ottowii]
MNLPITIINGPIVPSAQYYTIWQAYYEQSGRRCGNRQTCDSVRDGTVSVSRLGDLSRSRLP